MDEGRTMHNNDIYAHYPCNVQIGDRKRGIAMPMINDGYLSPIVAKEALTFPLRLTF